MEDVRYRKVSFVIEVGGDERNHRRKKSLHKYVGIARPSNSTTFGHGPMGTTAGQREIFTVYRTRAIITRS